MKILKLIIILSFSLNAFSQGYMGHKVTLRYNNLFFPQVYNLLDDYSTTDLSIRSIHSFSLGYVLGQRTELFVTYDRSNLDYVTIINETYVSDGYIYDQTKEVPVQISSTSYGFGMRLYSRDFMAPLGIYQQFDMLISMVEVRATNKENKGELTDSFMYPRIGWGIGVQRVIIGSLMYDIGVHSALSLFNPFAENLPQNRLFATNLLSLKIGLTYVL